MFGASLEKRIRSRLKAEELDGVRVEVHGGRVQLSGRTDTLWHRILIHQLVSRTPGVRETDTSRLRIERHGVGDRAVYAAVRAIVDRLAGAGASAITVSVTDGVVALAGTVADRKQIQRLLTLVSRVRGVRRIRSHLRAAPEERDRSARLAEEIESVLRGSDPRTELSVSVAGGVVVLRGLVNSYERKRELEKRALQMDGVRRVINKLRVRPGFPA